MKYTGYSTYPEWIDAESWRERIGSPAADIHDGNFVGKILLQVNSNFQMLSICQLNQGKGIINACHQDIRVRVGNRLSVPLHEIGKVPIQSVMSLQEEIKTVCQKLPAQLLNIFVYSMILRLYVQEKQVFRTAPSICWNQQKDKVRSNSTGFEHRPLE